MIDIDEIRSQNLPDEGDPLEWLWEHRREMSARFETVGEMLDYMKQFDSVENALVKVRAKIAEKNAAASGTAVTHEIRND